MVVNLKMHSMPGQANTTVVTRFYESTRPGEQGSVVDDAEKMIEDEPTAEKHQKTQLKQEIEESNSRNVFDLFDLSPYVREELKITIQRKRAEKGLEEIKVEDEHDVISYNLSEEELQKKLKRRERNKLAAAKLRKKNKLAEVSMHEEFVKQRELNKKLKYDLEKIEREKATILESLNESQSKKLIENKSVACLKVEDADIRRELNELYMDVVENSNRPDGSTVG
ncbi:uncharacterized protein [Antedon mediterranea]|uniref:uncharacterized protein n=1 Tax=Antedon mediterranea TaxID=105859 RepID=UPI003AF823A8